IRARVSGTADQAVTWSVQEGASGGSVDAAGVYTAPPNTEGTWHVVATSHADPSKSAISAITASWRDLHDHGGTVLASPKAYAIWWGDPSAWASDSKAGIEQVLGGLDGSSYLDILTQYMRGAKAGLEFAGSLADGAAPPPAADLYSTDVAAEVCKVLTDHGQQPEADALYLLFTSTAIDVAKVQACGWHSWGSCNDVKIAIALVPNSLGNERCSYPGVGACDAGITVATHTLASIAVHELAEMMTNPLPLHGGTTRIRSWTKSATPAPGTSGNASRSQAICGRSSRSGPMRRRTSACRTSAREQPLTANQPARVPPRPPAPARPPRLACTGTQTHRSRLPAASGYVDIFEAAIEVRLTARNL